MSEHPKRLAEFYRDIVGIPLEDEQHGQSHPHWGCTLGDGNLVEFTQLCDEWFSQLETRRRQGADVVTRWRAARVPKVEASG